MTNSWWKRTIALLSAILLTAMLFFLWTSFNLTNQVRLTVETENSSSLRLWDSDIESRTDAIYEHIYELLVTLHNSNQLRTGSPVMDAMTKKKIVDMMEDMLIVSSSTDAFFTFDTENDYYLFTARTGVDSREKIALKEYIRTSAPSRETTFRDGTWMLIRVGESEYLFKCVRLGKYLVGAVSSLAYYDITAKFSVLGDPCSFWLEDAAGERFFSKDSTGAEGTLVTRWIVSLNATACLSAAPVLTEGSSFAIPALLFANSAICLILILLLLRLLYKKVAVPSMALDRANRALAEGNLEYRLDAAEAGSAEFAGFYTSFNNMASQITRLRIEAYDMKLQEDANRLTMVRAQIRPHSILNAITTISNMTYFRSPEDIRTYIANIARFIRYMLNISEPWIRLSAELANVRNYLKIQEMRFPGAITLTEDCDEGVMGREIPFLLLYTLVENSLKHALTNYELLEIRISCRPMESESFRGICLTVEDNGEGFSQEAIDRLLSEDAVFAKEHLGLSNVRYTLSLLYHRSDLLRISNRDTGGARVEVHIPDREVDQ